MGQIQGKNTQHNPRPKSRHLIMPLTHTAQGWTCPAGVASEKIHSATHCFINGLCASVFQFGFAVKVDVGNAGKAKFAAGWSRSESGFCMNKESACASSFVSQSVRARLFTAGRQILEEAQKLHHALLLLYVSIILLMHFLCVFLEMWKQILQTLLTSALLQLSPCKYKTLLWITGVK